MPFIHLFGAVRFTHARNRLGFKGLQLVKKKDKKKAWSAPVWMLSVWDLHTRIKTECRRRRHSTSAKPQAQSSSGSTIIFLSSTTLTESKREFSFSSWPKLRKRDSQSANLLITHLKCTALQAVFLLLPFPITITSPCCSLSLIKYNPLGVFQHKLDPWPRADCTLPRQSQRFGTSIPSPYSHFIFITFITVWMWRIAT